MDASHPPADLSVVALFDHDTVRSAVLADALRADGWTVIAPPSPDALPAHCVVLFAPDRGRRGALRSLVTQFRENDPARQVLAVASVDPTVGSGEGRELLATTQAAGCDGCLLYDHPAEVTAVLRACVVTSCG